MADPTPQAQTGTGQPAAGLTISDDIAKKHPELIALIKASESMNDEERQYWINILPIMTPEQIQNLREILDNEKRQLAEIDQKYQGDVDKMGQAEAIKQTDTERSAKRKERQSQEAQHRAEEEKAEEELLRKMEEAGK